MIPGRGTLFAGAVPTLIVALGVYGTLLDMHERANPTASPPALVDQAWLGGPLVSLDRSTLQSAARESGASNELVDRIAQLRSSGIRLGSLGRSREMPTIDPDELAGHFRAAPSPQAAWSTLLERIDPAPGVLQYSPLARSEEGTEVLVVETYRCGPECGQSRLLRLEEGIAGWTVMAEVLLWIP